MSKPNSTPVLPASARKANAPSTHRQPGANPVARAVPVPRPAPGVLQPKSAPGQPTPAQPHGRAPNAPPAYRPQPTPKVLQRKASPEQASLASSTKRAPVAPPVYRPQPVPRVMQTKQAGNQSPQMSNARAHLAPTPPTTLQRKSSVQRKAVVNPWAKATTAPTLPAPRNVSVLPARAASGAVQAKPHAHTQAAVRAGFGHTTQPVRSSRGAAGIVQPYIADGWGNNCQGSAQTIRDNYREEITKGGYEGQCPNHVTGGVLEYMDRNGVIKVKRLEGRVSGNPRNSHDESLYKRETKVTSDKSNSECSEPKVLKQAAEALSRIDRGALAPRPTLYLSTEWTPCARCEGRIQKWRTDHPDVEIHISSGMRYTSPPHASTWMTYSINPDLTLDLTLPPSNPLILSGYVPAPNNVKKATPNNVKKATPNNMYDLLMEQEHVSKAKGKEELKDNSQFYPTNSNNQSGGAQKPKKKKKPKSVTPSQIPSAPVVVDNSIKNYVWGALGLGLTVGMSVAADWLMETGYFWAANSGE